MTPGRIAMRREPSTGRLTADGWTEETARRAIRERSGGWCETGCGRRAHSASHRRRRSQGGVWAPWNLADACGDGTTLCHGWFGKHPDLARAGGWEVDATADPRLQPVFLVTATAGEGWWLLGDEPGVAGPPRHLIVPADPNAYGLPRAPCRPPDVAGRAR